MRLHRLRSVRLSTTLAATLLTALVLGLASVLIVRLVEQDLESNAKSALSSALESASHSASGEKAESGEAAGESHGSAESGVGRADTTPADGSAETSTESAGDARQQALTDASIDEVQGGVDAASRALLIIVPAVVVALGIAIWMTVGRALKPVRDISAQVAEISGSTLDERIPVPPGQDEIAELAALMNEMLDRLQSSSERQRAFVADASHELRSPLSTIVAAAEIASVSPDPVKLQKLAGTLSSEAQRMQELVADLLDLARLDEDRSEPATASVDVAAVCREVVGSFEDSGPAVTLITDGPVRVAGVPSQIERVVINLVDNAVVHANAQVVVTADSNNSEASITVEDDGPGINPADRDRVFGRFVRLDSSRERGTGGTGIGLALVKAIVDYHRGTIQVGESARLGGACFTVTLPAAHPESSARP